MDSSIIFDKVAKRRMSMPRNIVFLISPKLHVKRLDHMGMEWKQKESVKRIVCIENKKFVILSFKNIFPIKSWADKER